MPELPEVETIKLDLEKTILHKTFQAVETLDPFVLRNTPQEFKQAFKKQSVAAVIRRGKALLIQLSNGQYLQVQLMMTGQLVVNGIPDKHTRTIFKFTDGSKLLYNDQRRFGQLRILKNLLESKHINALGPEPFDQVFNAEYIFKETRYSKRPVKNLLLDHTFVAGIGNIYACEILFRSKISPRRLSGRLSLAEAKDIHQKTVEVLQEAIKYRGSSMRNYRDGAGQKGTFNTRIQVYAKEGDPCMHCKKPIQRIPQSGRSTFFCPFCQK